jgi:hypothetical protein
MTKDWMEYFRSMYLSWARWLRQHHVFEYEQATKIGQQDAELGDLLMRRLAINVEIRDYLKKRYVASDDVIRRN